MEKTMSGFSELDKAFMLAAFDEAQRALDESEVPVGCVFVRSNKIIARGRNATNATLNGTRHAEFVAIDQILYGELEAKDSDPEVAQWAKEAYHNPRFFNGCTLYVTVEPCIMCASALKQMGVKNVVFGCGNDRFGGNGSVASIHRCDTEVKGSYGDPMAYPCRRGLFREEAIIMLRKFYLRENVNAQPEKRKTKTNRVLNTFVEPDDSVATE